MNKKQQTTTQRKRPFGRLLCVALIVLIVVSGILPVAKAAASITDLTSLTQIGNHTVDTASYPFINIRLHQLKINLLLMFLTQNANFVKEACHWREMVKFLHQHTESYLEAIQMSFL